MESSSKALQAELRVNEKEGNRRAVKSGTRELLRKEECSTNQGTAAAHCYMSA